MAGPGGLHPHSRREGWTTRRTTHVSEEAVPARTRARRDGGPLGLQHWWGSERERRPAMRLKAAFQFGSAGPRPFRLARRHLVIAALALTMISGAGLAGHAEPAHASFCLAGEYQ